MHINDYAKRIGNEINAEISGRQRLYIIEQLIKNAQDSLESSNISNRGRSEFWGIVLEIVKGSRITRLKESQSNQALMDLLTATAARIEAVSQKLAQATPQANTQQKKIR